jgi:hypothetical protein
MKRLRSSSRGESHPPALTGPCVTVAPSHGSCHPGRQNVGTHAQWAKALGGAVAPGHPTAG